MEFLEMAVPVMRFGIFMLFLLTASWQDWKMRQVSVRTFQIFGATGLGICFASGIGVAADVLAEAQSQMLLPELWVEVFRPFLFGMLPGLALFLFFKCGGEIGEGDCCFFLICGWYLGMWDTVFLLGGAVFLCGLAGLGYYVSGYIRGSQTGWLRGKTQWPFLPFAAVPGIWTAAVRLKAVIQMVSVMHPLRL